MEIVAKATYLDANFKYSVFALMKHDEFYDIHYAEVETLDELEGRLEPLPFSSPIDVQRFLSSPGRHPTDPNRSHDEEKIEQFVSLYKMAKYLQSKGLTVDIMYAPVDTVNGKTVTAASRAFSTLENIEHHLPNHIYLYAVNYVQAIDSVFGLPKIAYKIRYGV